MSQDQIQLKKTLILSNRIKRATQTWTPIALSDEQEEMVEVIRCAFAESNSQPDENVIRVSANSVALARAKPAVLAACVLRFLEPEIHFFTAVPFFSNLNLLFNSGRLVITVMTVDSTRNPVYFSSLIVEFVPVILTSDVGNLGQVCHSQTSLSFETAANYRCCAAKTTKNSSQKKP